MAKYETAEALVAEARQHLLYWQEALFLDGWTISLRADPAVKTPFHDEVRAAVSYDSVQRVAIVRLDSDVFA